MIQRIWQFYHALMERMDAPRKMFVAEHLSAAARELFCGMDEMDQCHAVRVAYTAQELAATVIEPFDEELLIRCALLHDIGRQQGDMGLWGKVYAVLMHHFYPSCRSGHVLFVYYHHAALGRELLESIGMVREASIIGQHHSRPGADDSIELQLLREADARN
jgi:putative nucleotidyltransferase with HDIG domain